MNTFSNAANQGPDLTSAPPATPSSVNAVVHVSIQDDGLTAYLQIDPPEGNGLGPTLTELEGALKAAGVSAQINRKLLEELAQAPLYHQPILIAQGFPPVHGVDGTVTFQVDVEKKTPKPKVQEDGFVDYHDLGIIENVQEGQVLCTLTHPTEGTPGVSVLGKPILQRKGKPALISPGKNTMLNEEGTAILSRINGQVDLIGRKIVVNETFYVKGNVDNSTGDIIAVGNIVVQGTVKPGFKLDAGGNVYVSGTVESSSIRAGGNITLLSGITGSELYCEGDMKSRFIENCTVYAAGEIRAEYVLNSKITCGKNLRVEGSIAKIIGGSCFVGQNIEARCIGSGANVKTQLTLGTAPQVVLRQQQLQDQICELGKQLESLKPLVTLLRDLNERNRLDAEKHQLLNELSTKYESQSCTLDCAEKELEELSQLVFARGYGRVICRGTIFPGVKVAMGSAAYMVTDPLHNASLYYQDGEIRLGSAR